MSNLRACWAVLLVMLSQSCAHRRSFRVIPAQPEYMLRSPDRTEVPFGEILERYTEVGPEWVELRPGMQLRIENAYFRGQSMRLADYLGTEMARYHVGDDGRIRLVSRSDDLATRPHDQPPVSRLMRTLHGEWEYHRLFFQVGFDRQGGKRTAVLLSAPSRQELDTLSDALLRTPEAICGDASGHCTVFPPSCTASLDIEVTVNGRSRTIIWGSRVMSVAPEARRVRVLRRHGGRLVNVEMDSADKNAMRLPLLPGDHVNWK